MAPRPTWQGHLRLSLVTCPVALYTATSPRGEVHFNLLHKDTHNRIKMITTDPDLGPVPRSDLVKGYEVSKGEYIVITPEEIESVRLESTRTLDIERFVDASEIDRLYWNDPYYLVLTARWPPRPSPSSARRWPARTGSRSGGWCFTSASG